MRRIYFETSALNYYLEKLDFEALLQTREFQKTQGREYLISTVTIWEILLTADEKYTDFLVFAAQNLFSNKLLASPTEIIVRFLLNAYPENKVNYDIFTDHNIGEIWKKMTSDNSVNFSYDKNDLKLRTGHLRKISKNIVPIIDNSKSLNHNDFLKNIANIVHVYYECLRDDGFLAQKKDELTTEKEIYFKTAILVVLVVMILRQDMFGSIMESFWKRAGISNDNPTDQAKYIFETYPKILHMGPIAEMSRMAYNQIIQGKTNRGLLLDCYHTIYAPYVDAIFTGDEGFDKLKRLENHYVGKLWHISELAIKYVEFNT